MELAFSPSLPRPLNPIPTYHPSSTDGQLAMGRLAKGCSDMRLRKWSSRSRLLGPVSIRVTPQGTRPMHRQLLLVYEDVWASHRGLTGKPYFWTLGNFRPIKKRSIFIFFQLAEKKQLFTFEYPYKEILLFLQNRLLLLYCSSVYEQFFQLHCCFYKASTAS